MLMRSYFAGGCFWCVTPIYKIYGVDRVVCGYSGGKEENPSYDDVKAQKTGHRETIMLEYDPEKISYDRLLDIYFSNIDPYDFEGQFGDMGHSYSPAIYYSSPRERELASLRIEELERLSGKKVFVAVEPFSGFYEAEDRHQDYYLKNPVEFEREMIGSGRRRDTSGLKTVFESARILFVGVSEKLVDDYLTMVNDTENVGKFIGEIHDPYSREQELEWIRGKLSEKARVFSMISKKEGLYIGNIELMDVKENTGELGIAVTAKEQNKGYGSEAIEAIAGYGINSLGLERIFLRTKPFNSRAVYVYKKCGFREYKRSDDHIYMELLREDYPYSRKI